MYKLLNMDSHHPNDTPPFLPSMDWEVFEDSFTTFVGFDFLIV